MPKNKETKTKQRASRTRNFATVIYPESAPEGWVELLNDTHIPALLSPLHDRDKNPDGTDKKPHYHLLLIFDSVKDFELQVKPIFDSIGGVGREFVNSQRGYARYLCHLDNPEKAQYEPSEVRQFAGANYTDIVQLPTDDIKLIKEIMAYIKANEIYSIAELLDETEDTHPEWYTLIVTSRCYIIREYIKSLCWERDTNYVRKADRPKIDTETGELISEN